MKFCTEKFFDTFSCLAHCFPEKYPDEKKYIIRKNRDKKHTKKICPNVRKKKRGGWLTC